MLKNGKNVDQGIKCRVKGVDVRGKVSTALSLVTECETPWLLLLGALRILRSLRRSQSGAVSVRRPPAVSPIRPARYKTLVGHTVPNRHVGILL